MGLFTIVSAIIFLSFGTTILVYLLKLIISALPIGNPFAKLKQMQTASILAENKALISDLQKAQNSADIAQLRIILKRISSSKASPLVVVDEIPVATEFYLTVLDCAVFVLEETSVRFSELPKFEELIQSRNDLLGRLLEVINIKNKLSKRQKEGEKPKEWAVKEVNSQEQSLREQLKDNLKEFKIVLNKLIEVSSKPGNHTNHKYH
jgi:hypothetical protein